MEANGKNGGRITFRLSEEEKTLIAALADKAGLNISSYVRYAVMNKSISESSKSPPLDRVLLSQLLGHIGEVGTELNKIAGKMNENGQVVTAQFIQECNQLLTLRSAVLKAIRRLDYDNKIGCTGKPKSSRKLPSGKRR